MQRNQCFPPVAVASGVLINSLEGIELSRRPLLAGNRRSAFIGVEAHCHTYPPELVQVLSMGAPRAAALTTHLLAF